MCERRNNRGRGRNSAHPLSAAGDAECSRDYVLIPGGRSAVLNNKKNNNLSSDRSACQHHIDSGGYMNAASKKKEKGKSKKSISSCRQNLKKA